MPSLYEQGKLGKGDKSYSEMHKRVYSGYDSTIILINSEVEVPCMGTLKEQASQDSSIDEKWIMEPHLFLR